jgi:hypothetical protein
MAQEDLFTDRPTTTLILTIEDLTLLELADATRVTAHHEDIRGSRRFVATVTLVSVGQDLLETLLSRALIASRYGTEADVRMAFVKTTKEAREHARAHARE